MAKEQFSRTKACATKTLYAVMKEMVRRGGSIPAKEIYPWVNENVALTEWEKEPAGKMQYIRWTNSFQFYSIDYQKAGFIVKKNGTWYITPEGEKALKKSAEDVMNIANDAYHEWRRLNPKEDKPEEPNDETAEKEGAEKLLQLGGGQHGEIDALARQVPSAVEARGSAASRQHGNSLNNP